METQPGDVVYSRFRFALEYLMVFVAWLLRGCNAGAHTILLQLDYSSVTGGRVTSVHDSIALFHSAFIFVIVARSPIMINPSLARVCMTLHRKITSLVCRRFVSSAGSWQPLNGPVTKPMRMNHDYRPGRDRRRHRSGFVRATITKRRQGFRKDSIGAFASVC